MLGKRDRLHDIVDEAMQEDAERKEGKSKAREKRVTINESLNVEHIIETVAEEDDGPIKEHLVDIAHQQRQSTRDAQRMEILDKFEGGPDVEVPQDIAELDGHTLEAFNMNDERERGFIDADGAYVERKDKEEEELAKDAWLSNIEVVSDEVKAKIKQREEQAATDSAALSEEELAKARRAMISLMQARETVMEALQRISHQPKDRRAPKPKPRVGRQEETPEALMRRQTIEAFTEAASTLMASGETDIYDQRKEELEHACTLLPSAGATALAGMLTADTGVEDMFADSDDEERAGAAAPSAPAQEQGAGEQGAASSSASASVPHNSEPSAPTHTLAQYDDWPISELRRVLTEAKVDISGVIEKADLILKVHELDQQQAAKQVPPGFILDPSSGYYYSWDSNMYWDAQSGYYSKDGQWLIYDVTTSQYKEVT